MKHARIWLGAGILLLLLLILIIFFHFEQKEKSLRDFAQKTTPLRGKNICDSTLSRLYATTSIGLRAELSEGVLRITPINENEATLSAEEHILETFTIRCYPEKTLETILAETSSEDEYAETQKILQIGEITVHTQTRQDDFSGLPNIQATFTGSNEEVYTIHFFEDEQGVRMKMFKEIVETITAQNTKDTP